MRKVNRSHLELVASKEDVQDTLYRVRYYCEYTKEFLVIKGISHDKLILYKKSVICFDPAHAIEKIQEKIDLKSRHGKSANHKYQKYIDILRDVLYLVELFGDNIPETSDTYHRFYKKVKPPSFIKNSSFKKDNDLKKEVFLNKFREYSSRGLILWN